MVGEMGEYAGGATEPRAYWERVQRVPGPQLVETDPDRCSLDGFECAVSGAVLLELVGGNTNAGLLG